MRIERDPDNKHKATLILTDVPRPHRALYNAVWGWGVKAAELSGTELTEFIDGFNPDPNEPSTWTFEFL
jgi:hypothetical protein